MSSEKIYFNKNRLIEIFVACRYHLEMVLFGFDENKFREGYIGENIKPSEILAHIIDSENYWFSEIGFWERAPIGDRSFAEYVEILNENKQNIIRILENLESEFPPIISPAADRNPPSPAWAALRCAQHCLYHSAVLEIMYRRQVNIEPSGDPSSWERAADSFYTF